MRTESYCTIFWSLDMCVMLMFLSLVVRSENDMGEILDMVAKLEPLFAADALLSRSVVACLDYGSLLTVLLKFNIPIEVIGATLAFNIHHRGRTPQSKEVSVCVQKMSAAFDMLEHSILSLRTFMFGTYTSGMTLECFVVLV